MKLKTIIFSAALYAIAIMPNAASAYEVINTTAYKLTDTTSLFTITYEFGYLNGVAAMPMVPTYMSAAENTLPKLAYEITNQAGEVLSLNNQNTTAVVLSGATLNNKFYYQIAAGDRQQFTLLVLHTTNDASLDSQPQTLSVTSFGHQVDANDRVRYMTVSDAQLEDYQSTLESN